MNEPERLRVQRLPWKACDSRAQFARPRDAPAAAAAVDGVADHRVAALGEVDPDLVGAPGGEPAFDQRGAPGKAAFDPVAGQRRLAVGGAHHRHLLPIARAAADIAGDLARRWSRDAPYEGGIGAFDPPRREVAA